MAENDRARRMAKLRAILNADAAIITILLAVGGGIVHVTNQIAVLQSTSDSHTAQIEKLNTAHETDNAKTDWIMRQLDQIRLQLNAPSLSGKPATAWPQEPSMAEDLTGKKSKPPKIGLSRPEWDDLLARKNQHPQIAGKDY